VKHRHLHRARHQGFSLVELMIGITLSLLLLIALGSLYLSTTRTRSEFSNSAEQMENGRYTLDALSRELELAGFFGPSGLARSAVTSSPDVCAADAAALGFVGSPVTMPLGVQGFAPGTAAPCLDYLLPASEILVVRRVSTTPAAAVSAGQAYLQASACPDDTDLLVFGASAPAFKLRTKACNAAVPAELRQALVRIFYLAGCDQCSGSGDGVPTLKMAELDGGTFRFSSLAQGIEDVHFVYGVDMDGNGSPDCYVGDPGTNNAAACTTVAGYDWNTPLNNWRNVTAVRVNVLARTPRKSTGWTDSRTYDVGRGPLVGPFNDGYKRHTYAQVARLANVAGPRE